MQLTSTELKPARFSAPQPGSPEACEWVEENILRWLSEDQWEMLLRELFNHLPPASRARIRQEVRAIPLSDENNEPAEWIDPAMVRAAFQRVSKKLNETTRRPVVRLQRLWNAFRGRENDILPTKTLVAAFERDGCTHPERDAPSAISWLNQALADSAINLEIEHVSGYRFRVRDPSIPRL